MVLNLPFPPSDPSSSNQCDCIVWPWRNSSRRHRHAARCLPPAVWPAWLRRLCTRRPLPARRLCPLRRGFAHGIAGCRPAEPSSAAASALARGRLGQRASRGPWAQRWLLAQQQQQNERPNRYSPATFFLKKERATNLII